MTSLASPYPYMGGKSRISGSVWARLGDPPNYIEPCLGSAAMLLARPNQTPEKNRIETVNDADGFIPNLWRAIAAAPDDVAKYADWPVSECDLHARHSWLVNRRESITSKLEGDPEWFDVKAAGWWLWGICCWIGGGWCAGVGPWKPVNGELVSADDSGGVERSLPHLGNAGRGINRQRPHLLGAGQGIKRSLPHLGDAGQGINRRRPHLGNAGQGINRKLPHLGDAGNGINRQNSDLYAYMAALSERFSRVRVCCGDWSRVCGDTPTIKNGVTGVFFDPPYSGEAGRDNAVYAIESKMIAHDVRAWCLERGDNPMYRIALCGYEGEGHEELENAGWRVENWKAKGGYGSQGDGAGRVNKHRERVWYSPHCISTGLFEEKWWLK